MSVLFLWLSAFSFQHSVFLISDAGLTWLIADSPFSFHFSLFTFHLSPFPSICRNARMAVNPSRRSK